MGQKEDGSILFVVIDGRQLGYSNGAKAFLVFEHPDQVDIPNIWQGLRPQDIDAGKK
ncbi:hypothetical protein D3C78_1991460 [compost metagenome]